EQQEVTHRDGGHRKGQKNRTPPFERFVQQGLELHAIPLLIEKFFQIFSRRKAVSLAGDNQNAKVLVISQRAKQLHHFVMKLRVHGVFLVGPVQGDGDDIVFTIDENRFVIRHYGFLLF